MAQHNVNATLIIRNDTASNWRTKNPILAKGEIGAEIDTGLLKMGDGIKNYNNLDYINQSKNVDNKTIFLTNGKLTLGNYGESYYTFDPQTKEYTEIIVDQYTPLPSNLEAKVVDGTLIWVETVVSEEAFADLTDLVNSKLSRSGGTMTGQLTLAGDPSIDRDAATKGYVDRAVANAGHLKREIVNALPAANEADEHTIYMMLDTSVPLGDKYKEYMLINGVVTQIGDTSVNLSNYIEKPGTFTAGNIPIFAADGSIVDSGANTASMGALAIATDTVLGGVYSSSLDNYIAVDTVGRMKLNRVSTNLLYVPDGDEFILNGGTA